MDDSTFKSPATYNRILEETLQRGFEQLSDIKVCALLATLCKSKPNGNFLELGTGTGLATSWMLDGMCSQSSLVTVENDPEIVNVARRYLGSDPRVSFKVEAGETAISEIQNGTIDFIFADTWPGKYNQLDEALALLKVGGIYLIDDMKQHADWPETHSLKAKTLAKNLVHRDVPNCHTT